MVTSIIIPTLNAGDRIVRLLQSIMDQTVVPDEILILDSESTDDTVEKCCRYEKVKVYHIKRSEFDHGGTRDYGMSKSKGDIVFYLTDDAVIMENDYIESMLNYFEDEDVALVTGRQVARPEATEIERLTREYNYPDKLLIRTKKDISKLGIKAFFASDVCSAYRKSFYYAVGGFESPILISEDMLIAAQFLFANMKIVYAPEAKVIHSHSYTLKQQFSRNFDIGVVLAQHEDIFEGIPVQSEGIRMVRWVMRELLRHFRFISMVHYIFECAAKLLGNKMGMNYDNLSMKTVMACTMNKKFWEKDDIRCL
ncbi:MAG: glycosyltransferase family 2 protein [Oscillospiraceae bacterium]|nr:glycosyltransferase family 2 protein [Oscillospiraceae bacterium]